MLTVDSRRLGLGPGQRVLDIGCGKGRHAAEARRRGAVVMALDLSAEDAAAAAGMLVEAGPGGGGAVAGDALALPLAPASVDVAIAAEVFEHVPDDRGVAGELHRVLRPGAMLAVTVPRWLPERICWALAEDYHAPAVAGGHVRIYRRRALVELVSSAGFELVASHHAHALHTPYWWLRCALGVSNTSALPTRLYHRLLVWEIMARPRSLRLLEHLLNPLLGKSLVVYFRRLPDRDVHPVSTSRPVPELVET